MSHQNSSPTYECGTMILRVVRQLLHHYFDFKNQLKLDYVSSCLKNYKKCMEDHSKNIHGCVITTFDYIPDDILLKGDKSTVFLKLMGDMVNRKEFPYVKNIQYLLELILAINPPNSPSYTTNHVITLSTMTFSTIIIDFPPCYPAFRSTYLQLLRNKEFVFIGGHTNNMNLFQFVISKLKHLISDEEGELINGSLVFSQQNHDSYDSVVGGETENQQAYQFDLNNRSEQIERLFIVLDLLVTLFEYDLSVFMMRERNPYARLDKLLYVNAMPDELTEQMEFEMIILKLFIDCICLDFPNDKVQVLSRCVHLLNFITNMSDKKSLKDLFYPCVRTKTTKLIHNYERILKDHQHLNFKSFLSVMDNIKMSRIKLELINLYIRKVVDRKFDGSFHHICEYMNNRVWLKYPKAPPNNADCKAKESKDEDEDDDDDDDNKKFRRRIVIPEVFAENVQEEIVTSSYILSFKDYTYPRIIQDDIKINDLEKMCQDDVMQLIKLQLKTHLETVHIPKTLPETIICGALVGKTSNETLCERCLFHTPFDIEEYLNLDEIYKIVFEVIDCYIYTKNYQTKEDTFSNEFIELFTNLNLNKINL